MSASLSHAPRRSSPLRTRLRVAWPSLLLASSVGSASAQAPADACSDPATARFELELDGGPVTVGSAEEPGCVVTSVSSLWCWAADRSAGCTPPTPVEVVGVRGRAASVVTDGEATFVLSTDGTVAAWGHVGAWARVAPATSADVVLVRGPEGPLHDVASVVLSDAELHAVDRTGTVWTVPRDGEASAVVASRRALDHPVSRVACDEVCCAIGPDRAATCWGDGAETLTAMLQETAGWVSWVASSGGACVATERRVECTGWLRPDAGRFRFWRGFELLGTERVVALTLGPEDEVCLETTTSTRCWGATDAPLSGVRPLRSVVRRRLARGERVLRARVSGRTCSDGPTDVAPRLSAHATPGRVRFEVGDLVSNCGYEPTIDVTLASDGTVTLARGDPPPDSPLARCECAFDIGVVVRGIPPGPHRVVLLDDADAVVRSTDITAR